MKKIIQHISIVEQVVEYLGECIRNGTWKPGEKIDSESELTKELQVSRSSVRYAIQQFIALGVLESFQGKGTFVKALPVNDLLNRLEMMYENIEIKQLLEFRSVIEVEVCRVIAQSISDATLKKLEDCLNKMKEYQDDDSDELINYDIEFHSILLREMGNKLIVKTMETVREEIKKQQMTRITPPRIAIKHHEDILEALKKHNGHAAAEAMRVHLYKNIKELDAKRAQTEKNKI